MIDLIIKKDVSGSGLLVVQTWENEDGCTIQSPLRLATDINEAAAWVRERGGAMGTICNLPYNGRCRLASIEHITLDDAFRRQEIWGDPTEATEKVVSYVHVHGQ